MDTFNTLREPYRIVFHVFLFYVSLVKYLHDLVIVLLCRMEVFYCMSVIFSTISTYKFYKLCTIRFFRLMFWYFCLGLKCHTLNKSLRIGIKYLFYKILIVFCYSPLPLNTWSFISGAWVSDNSLGPVLLHVGYFWEMRDHPICSCINLVGFYS